MTAFPDYQDWGLQKLFERIDHETDDERRHADALIERIEKDIDILHG